MNIFRLYAPTAMLGLMIMSAGCTQEPQTVNLGLDDSYYVSRMQKLPLTPALSGSSYRWTVNGKEVSTQHDYVFLAADEGVYDLTFDIIDDNTPFHFEFTVTVMHEEVEYSPYITRVYEYCPAPGQFVNKMPVYDEGDTYADMLKKAEESISGTKGEMISLGAYGGYITFGFDHTVVNVEGEYDFRIWGNSFYQTATGAARPGGSSEAGIVMVSYDANCNGIPDDEWYELAGSAHNDPATIHGYDITYYRDYDVVPENIIHTYELMTPVKDLSSLTLSTSFPWADSCRRFGFVSSSRSESRRYWPGWVSENTMSFKGTCLPPNAEDISGNGSNYILYSFDWGYADNHPNDKKELNSFKIDWAIDSRGEHVSLPGVDFIRVYTGINQHCGWIGETSTEISRAADLHIDGDVSQ